MSGWADFRQPFLHVNSFGQQQNCYFCTVAALHNQTTNELAKHTETMMQDTATMDDALELFRDAGDVGIQARRFATPAEAAAFVNQTVEIGHAVGLGYKRANGTDHMVVLRRMLGLLDCVDYQAEWTAWGTAPRMLPFPPEPGPILAYVVFHI